MLSLIRLSTRPHHALLLYKVVPCRTRVISAVRTSVSVATSAGREIPPEARRSIGRWLLGCSGMVCGAVVLGGVTRLTESGLSMVNWHMFKELPPLGEMEWISEFEKYKQFPEFKFKHQDFTLDDFKWIWYMEYIHRMWGRATGGIFLLPAIYFWSKGWFPKAMKVRVTAFGALLGIQGLLGWYMVKSGLKENHDENYLPRVSPQRLALHLGTAFILYTLFLWSAFSHLLPPQQMAITPKVRNLWKLAHVSKGIAFLTVVSGAFVAGLNAGLVYNTFPKMADKWIPSDVLALEPKRINFTQNPVTAQFVHRIMGTSTAFVVTALWLYARRLVLPSRVKLAVNCVFGMGMLQVSLGIATLLLHVPIPLAATHQAGALALLSTAVWLTHEMKVVRRVTRF